MAGENAALDYLLRNAMNRRTFSSLQDEDIEPWMMADYDPVAQREEQQYNEIRNLLAGPQTINEQPIALPQTIEQISEQPKSIISPKSQMSINDIISRNGVITVRGNELSEGTNKGKGVSVVKYNPAEGPELSRARRLAELENEMKLEQLRGMDELGIPSENRQLERQVKLEDAKNRGQAQLEMIKADMLSGIPERMQRAANLVKDWGKSGDQTSSEAAQVAPTPTQPKSGPGLGTAVVGGAATILGYKYFKRHPNAAKSVLSKLGLGKKEISALGSDEVAKLASTASEGVNFKLVNDPSINLERGLVANTNRGFTLGPGSSTPTPSGKIAKHVVKPEISYNQKLGLPGPMQKVKDAIPMPGGWQADLQEALGRYAWLRKKVQSGEIPTDSLTAAEQEVSQVIQKYGLGQEDVADLTMQMIGASPAGYGLAAKMEEPLNMNFASRKAPKISSKSEVMAKLKNAKAKRSR